MPVTLHPKTLANLTTVRTQTFNTSAQLQTNNRVSNGAGGFSDNWATVVTLKVKVRRPKRLQSIQQSADQAQAESRYEILCPSSQAVTAQQRFLVGSTQYFVLGTDGGITDGLMQICQVEVRK